MTIINYQAGLRSATRGLWNGVLDRRQFNSNIKSTINRRLSQAWQEGAAECDILPGDFTQAEFTAMGKTIQGELRALPKFADMVQKNSKANGGKLTPLLDRINTLWVNRYRDIRNQAKVLTCKDKKFRWKLGATEVHCSTCPKLDGKVKRGSEWRKSGIRPQNPPNKKLECGGWNCLCELNSTTLPISKGRLPSF